MATSPGRAPRLLTRERQLLALLDALGGRATREDFQLLLFLYCEEAESGQPYDFVPRGALPRESLPHSFTVEADCRRLVEHGLLEEDGEHWSLTKAGRDALADLPDALLAAFAKRHASTRGKALASAAVRVLAPRLPHPPRRKKGTGSLKTIGYEGLSLESYLNALLHTGVTLLCDVRGNPFSRKFGFAKATLSGACEAVGLRYEHLPELGIATDRRKGIETPAEYAALFAEYERKWLPKQTPALEKIRDWVLAGECVALTCYERLPEHCHRHCVAEALEERYGPALRAENL